MSDVAVAPPPAPLFLSDAARAGLEQPIVPTQYPSLDDRSGWEQWVGQTDAMVAEMLSGMPPFADSELRDIAGVPTYVLTRRGPRSPTARRST